MARHRNPVFFLAALAALLTCGCGPGPSPALSEKLNPYLYEDTRQLVSMVEDAADLLAARGEPAFDEFSVKGSRWFDDSHYLFVYALDGTCMFHPVAPELVGHNLMSLRDVNGKPVIKFVTDVGRLPGDTASRWVFYEWQEGTQLDPRWKASYIRKVVHGNRTYVIGSGKNTLKTEKIWVQDAVDRAAERVKRKPETATFRMLTDVSSEFRFFDIYVLVLDANGRTVVDPAYPTLQGRDLSSYRDAAGRQIMRDVLHKLASTDRAWDQFLANRSGESVPSRKLLYVRKVQTGGQTYYVASDYFVSTPIWMGP